MSLVAAAMAIYAFQAFASCERRETVPRCRGCDDDADPPGGATLWDIVWANTPDEQAGAADVLRWMRPCGFIGLEFAAVARKLGHQVVLAEARPRLIRLMARRLSPQMARLSCSPKNMPGWACAVSDKGQQFEPEQAHP